MNKNICGYCFNARICEDGELTDDNDFSAICIGEGSECFRVMFCSGWGQAPRIEFDMLGVDAIMHTVARYFPKFCPECGRKITEYDGVK